MMPSKVTSAWQAPAIVAPSRTARSACSEPSLQINILMPLASFCGVSGQKAVEHEARSNQGKGDKSHANAQTAEILGQSGADLRAERRPGVHNQSDQDIDVA